MRLGCFPLWFASSACFALDLKLSPLSSSALTSANADLVSNLVPTPFHLYALLGAAAITVACVVILVMAIARHLRRNGRRAMPRFLKEAKSLLLRQAARNELEFAALQLSTLKSPAIDALSVGGDDLTQRVYAFIGESYARTEDNPKAIA